MPICAFLCRKGKNIKFALEINYLLGPWGSLVILRALGALDPGSNHATASQAFQMLAHVKIREAPPQP